MAGILVNLSWSSIYFILRNTFFFPEIMSVLFFFFGGVKILFNIKYMTGFVLMSFSEISRNPMLVSPIFVIVKHFKVF